MSLVDWTNDLSVGLQEIDDQHKMLLSIINNLHDAMRTGNGKEIIQKIIEELIQYTVNHFKFEEDTLKKHGYINLISHKREHDALTKRVKELQAEYVNGNLLISIELRDFIRQWILNHIMKTDMLYSNLFK